MSKSPEVMYDERLKRIQDAIALKKPDRVPVVPLFEMFPAHYAGITVHEAMTDYAKANEAWKKTILDFDPDAYLNPILAYPSRSLEALDYQLLKLPGRDLASDKTYQFVEDEYMQAEDYDAFLDDPSDYMIRTYYPRVFKALEPFKALAPLHDGYWLGMLGVIASFSNPELPKAFEALVKAGNEMMDWFVSLGTFDAQMKELGYPCFNGAATFAPFDVIGDTMRGTRGIMLDMYRQPDKLLKAIERVTPWTLDMGINGAKMTGNSFVWFFLHKGIDNFMSDEQFREFYWPSLREVIVGLVDAGMTPCVYSEGRFNDRLEVLADVPKGKVLYHFEEVDMKKAKEILGDVACISGNVPLSLLTKGTPEQVKEYCKFLIDVVGEGGGFILDTDAVIDEASVENVRAMIDFSKEYGVY